MTNQQTTPIGVTRIESKGKITLDNIKPSLFKKGTLTAQIRQIFTTLSKYPSMKVESDMQDSLFPISDFGAATRDYDSTEQRVAWIFVPMNITEEAMKVKLEIANENGATIYKVLSNAPKLDSNQQAGVNAGLTTFDTIANKQAVRYPVGHAQENQLIKDKAGNVQYRRTFYSNSPKADIDLRDGVDIYLTPEIEAEVHGAGVLEGQKMG